jgi:hypothetical protein
VNDLILGDNTRVFRRRLGERLGGQDTPRVQA